jgi:hypothetical protein
VVPAPRAEAYPRDGSFRRLSGGNTAFVVRTMFATYWTVLVVGIVVYLIVGATNS